MNDLGADRGYEAAVRARAACAWITRAVSDQGSDFPTEIRSAIAMLQEALQWWYGERDGA